MLTTIDFANTLLFLSAGLVVAGMVSSLIAQRFGAPLLLVFLLLGMLAGENGPGGLHFNDYATTYLVGSLALAIILFDGGLRTRTNALSGAVAPAALLATAGVLITTLLTGFVAALALRLTLLEGMLVGAVVASTDAAAVFFLLRTNGLQLKRRVNAVLEIESSTNDPVAVFLVVALVEIAMARSSGSLTNIAEHLIVHAGIGALAGLGGGYLIVTALNRLKLPSGLPPLFTVACAVMIFGLAAVAGGSAFLAVYLAGLVVGNRPVRAFPSILTFHDAATWLCQIVMFLVLGLLVTPKALLYFALPGLAIALFLIFLGRPIAVWLCLTPFRFSVNEKLFVSWVGLRGAVSIFLAAIPTLAGLPNAYIYFNVAFFVVLVSLVVQGWSVPWTARRWRVALADPAPEVDRVEIDLPGQLDLEMVGYPILKDSPVMDRGALPSWAKPVLVVRDGQMLTPEQAGVLRVGDYGYFLAPPIRVRRLDRLFAPFEGHHDRALAGVFTFGAETALADLAEAYGVPVAADVKDQTLGALFADTFEESVREGDRIALGPVTLVARQVEDGAALAVALVFEDPDRDPVLTPPSRLDRAAVWIETKAADASLRAGALRDRLGERLRRR
jgi:cell volume regulation protein A